MNGIKHVDMLNNIAKIIFVKQFSNNIFSRKVFDVFTNTFLNVKDFTVILMWMLALSKTSRNIVTFCKKD